MFHTSLQRTKLQIVHAGFNERVNSLFQEIKKREFVTRARFTSDVQQRDRNGRRRRRKMRYDFLVTDHFQDVAHSLRQLAEGDHVFVIPQVQIKRNALGDVIRQPPARISGFISRPRDRSVQPIAIELEKLPRIGAEIWKLFLKRDHDSC